MKHRKRVLYITVLFYAIVTTLLSGQYFAIFLLLSGIVLIIMYILLDTGMFVTKTELPVMNGKITRELNISPVINDLQGMSEVDNFSIKNINLKPLIESISKELNPDKYFQQLFTILCKELNMYQAVYFIKDDIDNKYVFAGQFALFSDEFPQSFYAGEGLHGQVVLNKKVTVITELTDRIIVSGLGKCKPVCISIIPLLNKSNDVWGILELAFLNELTIAQIETMDFLMQNLTISKLVPLHSNF